MKWRALKKHVLLPAPLAAVLVLSCADPSTAPESAKRVLPGESRLSVVQVPGQLALLEGRIELCKATESVGAPAATFTFDVSVDAGATTNPTVSMGGCIDIVNDVSTPNSHTAAVSEQTLMHWALDSVRVEYPLECVNFPSSEDGTAATLQSNNDCGVRVTFWNSYAPPGCSLTQGYWKTHSELGPAPYDDTWALLAGGAGTTFFLSGQTWLEVFNTAPGGNAYYNLAHQYMAAVLNGMGGADVTDIATELATADGLFGTYTPAQIGALKGNATVRQQFIALADALGAYNEGVTGPGHCDY